ncbi:multidrug efflux SMR transporter [Paenibacillus melissococcoides]|uniref:Multidrug efflux SMR transporter n=1 Tax=Paenibacillus melissococcoides TaxID=2912268 RepID=A0ABN8UBQ1_9BACL|nr:MULTISPECIES: multidrug efflux SMR transporter [Paenibacillus]MEB9893755.1 multidrug efflux SMR transporter [Bacillus cereus]CAH8248572.1 multidrug efflux SMR transporter [Paenibacillus melissococcoides]CAH8714369.1 multidrug efflux SMR transporter [Paenibacillus melissococcoides]CAH8719865.1 multidrug efflux SMR transporter [Paenibacillus melissococcoides]GIO79599.1 putative membrane protein YvdS [Paenibacillus dendritiformis]
MAWLLVLVAALMEIVWASGLKYASTTWEWIGVIILITVSYLLLIQSYRRLNVAIAYTVFVGIGTIGTYAASIYLGEAFNGLQITFLLVLLTGIIGMKLSTPNREDSGNSEGRES